MSPATAGLPSVLIVAGPTCSGKSALALEFARRLDGMIINADSMQIYRELRVLTARPTEAEEAEIPHALYGVRPACEASSAAWWRDAALAAITRAHEAGRLPILCGGTGLYFHVLSNGLAEIPDPGENARAEARALLAEIGAPALHARLEAADPDTARNLSPTDGQRIARAWEVWRGTGVGLIAWQARPGKPAAIRPAVLRLDPPREELRAAIERRFGLMLDRGALDEVRNLMDQGLDPALPAMRAHGVPELSAYLRGELPMVEAKRRACLVTGQYTKRQATWFRHHILGPSAHTHTIHARYADQTQFSESEWGKMINIIRGGG